MILGPAPCHDCRLPLYLVRDANGVPLWVEWTGLRHVCHAVRKAAA